MGAEPRGGRAVVPPTTAETVEGIDEEDAEKDEIEEEEIEEVGASNLGVGDVNFSPRFSQHHWNAY